MTCAIRFIVVPFGTSSRERYHQHATDFQPYHGNVPPPDDVHFLLTHFTQPSAGYVVFRGRI